MADFLDEQFHLKRHAWVADQGDGTYRNPVLHADYSDPDAIRVGDKFYMTASSFSNAPGLPLLESTDLVNWALVGHALTQLVPGEAFATPQPGKGVWAPCLRYHDGKFWIFYPDPDFGVYVTTAERFDGPWSAPHLLLPGKGIIDPTPLWDEDGRAWLLHAWAKSRAGISNLLTLREMAPDGRSLLDTSGKVIIDGNRLPGYTTLEGPKFYKANGYYYVFAPAGGVEHGWQSVFRSRRIEGPYEDRIVMAQGNSPTNGPHQGAWVQAADGSDWFIHFQDKRAYGRVVHLQPMQWKDGWPLIGADRGQAAGEPVQTFRKPVGIESGIRVPATSDEFGASTLGLQWQWNANWKSDWYALDARPGQLRLFAQPMPDGGSLRKLASVLTQKLPASTFTVDTKLELNAAGDARAGLVLLGMNYAWLGVRSSGGMAQVVYSTCESAKPAEQECSEQVAPLGPLGKGPLYLRMRMEEGGVAQFSWSVDQRTFKPTGKPFTAVMGRWVGAQLGLFAAGAAAGHADVDYFRVTP
ncbi:MAG: glycoside hydrolase 43 family protein [Gammaproteobacteria bacterium]